MTPGLVAVKDAAVELGMSALTLRWLMAEGELPIGYVVAKPGSQRRQFLIYRKNLDEEKKRRGMG